jgi:hypothetical protein
MVGFDYKFASKETSTYFLFEVYYQRQPSTLVNQVLQAIDTPVFAADDRLSNLVDV